VVRILRADGHEVVAASRAHGVNALTGDGLADALAGPDTWPLNEIARKFLSARGDRRQVIADLRARYFGAELDELSLVPGDHPRFGPTSFDDWLRHQASH
jgi:uncharacterized protein YbjT (DUF2867 family)